MIIQKLKLNRDLIGVKIQNYNSKFKSLNILLFLFLLLNSYFLIRIFQPAPASAETAAIKLTPSVIRIQAEPPSDIRVPVQIENHENKSIELKSEFRLFRSSDKENGQIEYIPIAENKSSFFKNVSLLDGDKNLSSLTLGPKQKKGLILKINIPDDEPISDHYFSVVFTHFQNSYQPSVGSDEQHSISRINMGIAANVILSIQKEQTEDKKEDINLRIEEFSTEQLIEKGPVSFNINVYNNTSRFVNPKASLEIRNTFGQLIGKIDLPATTILANSRRFLTANQSQESLSFENKVIWNEKFLLGSYTAKVIIKPSPDSKAISSEVTFFAFPYRTILIILIASYLIFITIKRVRAKMS